MSLPDEIDCLLSGSLITRIEVALTKIERVTDPKAKVFRDDADGRWKVKRNYDKTTPVRDLGYADDYEAAKVAKVDVMTSHQCGVAAEAYAAYLLARSGYDVSVQYGANQPGYDLIAVKASAPNSPPVRVSVKGSQDGGWMLVTGMEKADYHGAIDRWLKRQQRHGHLVFLFVQFLDVGINSVPRAYLATPEEIAGFLKAAKNGKGHLVCDESRDGPGREFTPERLEAIAFPKPPIG